MPGKPSTDSVNEKQVPENQVREITLTDKLNKKLLTSFLERMNSGNQFDRFMDEKDNAKQNCDNDEFSS